jgi:hypothetical protein
MRPRDVSKLAGMAVDGGPTPPAGRVAHPVISAQRKAVARRDAAIRASLRTSTPWLRCALERFPTEQRNLRQHPAS